MIKKNRIIKSVSFLVLAVFPFTMCIDPAMAQVLGTGNQVYFGTDRPFNLPTLHKHFQMLNHKLAATQTPSYADEMDAYLPAARQAILSELNAFKKENPERSSQADAFIAQLEERFQTLATDILIHQVEDFVRETAVQSVDDVPLVSPQYEDPYGNASYEIPRETAALLAAEDPEAVPAHLEDSSEKTDGSDDEEGGALMMLSVSSLMETVEIQFTPEIVALATLLEGNPAKIYEYVLNNVRYEPYFGSHKGAENTLRSGAGNDVDQASLLLALLRASNIPSDYVYGSVRLSLEEAMNLVGVSEPGQVEAVFQSNGVPVRQMIGEDLIEFDHVWVNAEVNYGPYWGAKQGEGTINSVALDPTIALSVYRTPNDVGAAVGVNPPTFLSGIIDHPDSVVDPAGHYTTALPHDGEAQGEILPIIPQLAIWGSRILAYMNANGIETVDALFERAEIVPEKYGIIPASLPFDTIQIWQVFSEVPVDLRYQISLDLKNPVNGSTVLARTFSLPELSGRRLTLNYRPATPEDTAELTSYLNQSEIPLFAGIEVSPELTFDGFTDQSGVPVGLGKTQELRVTFRPPTYPADIQDEEDFIGVQDITAGSFYSLIFSSQKVTGEMLRAEEENVSQFLDLISADPASLTLESKLGTALGSAVTNLIYQESQLNNVTESIAQVVVTRAPSLHIASQALRIEDVLGLPYMASVDGVIMKTIRDQRIPVSVTGRDGDEADYLTISAMVAQGLAASSLEQAFQVPGASATGAIVSANESSIPVYSLKSLTEFASVAGQLTALSPATRGNIQNALNDNKQVTFPGAPVGLSVDPGGVEREAYVAIDRSTGSSRYFFEGGLDAIAPHEWFTPAGLMINDAAEPYDHFVRPVANWLGMATLANVNVSLSFLPAAESVYEWISTEGSPEEEVTKTSASILSVNGPMMTITGVPLVTVPEMTNPVFSPQIGTSPPGDPLPMDQTAVDFRMAHADSWQVVIRNASGGFVRSFTGTDSPARVVWDGKSQSGLLQNDGTYSFEIVARNDDGESSIPVTAQITLDRSLPEAAVTFPQGAVNAGRILIKGTADDPNFDYYHVVVRQGTTVYEDIEMHMPVINSALAYWDGSEYAPGNYTITLEVLDHAGNVSRRDKPFTLNPAVPFQILLPGAGDTVLENYSVYVLTYEPGIDTLKFYADDTTSANHIGNITGIEEPGTYARLWNTMGWSPGPHTLIVQGYNGAALIHTEQRSVVIEQPASGGVEITNWNPPAPNPLVLGAHPFMEMSATINMPVHWRVTGHARPNTNGQQNMVFDSGISPTPSTGVSVSWDGRNLEGDYVAEDIYDFFVWYIFDPNIPENRYMLAWAEQTVWFDESFGDPSLKAQIESPEYGSALRGTATIKGTVSDAEDSSVEAQVIYRSVKGTGWQESGEPVIVQVDQPLRRLGTFDAMTVADGVYEVAVKVTDSDNNVSYSLVMVYRVSGGLKLGNFTYNHVDLDINVDGVGVRLIRNYDSLRSSEPTEVGYGWQMSMVSSGLERVGPYDVLLTMPDGERHYLQFNATPVDWSFGGGLSDFREVRYQDLDPSSGLTVTVDDAPQVFLDGGVWYTLEWEPWEEVFNLSDLTVTTRVGDTFRFGNDGLLDSVSNQRGRTLALKDDGIYLDSARRVEFTRDLSGRITDILAPGGVHLNYAYDSNGDLRSFKHTFDDTEPKGYVIEHVYGDGLAGNPPIHYLVKVREQQGWSGTAAPFTPVMVTRLVNEWDETEKKLTGIKDTGGRGIDFDYLENQQKAIVTDAVGRSTTYEYDDWGNVIRVTNAADETYEYTYDDYGNRKTMTDPLNNVTRYEYPVMYGAVDIFGSRYYGWTVNELYNQLNDGALSQGLYQFFEFWNGIPHPSTVHLPNGEIQTYEYSREGRLLHADGPLQFTHHEYAPSGELKFAYARDGSYVAYDHNDNGEITSVTHSEFDVETAYDYTDGRLTKIVQNTRRPPTEQNGVHIEQNDLGLIETSVSLLGEDEVGPVAARHYTEQGMITDVMLDGETMIEMDWTPTGQPKRVAAGTPEYPGREVITEYFGPGESWPGENPDFSEGRAKQVLYNGIDLTIPDALLRTEYHYGEDTVTEKNVRNSSYEEITRSIDGLVQEVRERDGRVVSYTYDGAGRKTHFYEDGVLQNRRLYDDAGRVVAEWDYRLDPANPDETLRDYDEIGRPKSVTLPGGAHIEFTYDFGTGNLETITDQRGTTTYTYNASAQLERITYDDGTFVTYSYDDRGRVTRERNEVGQEIYFEYDPNYENDRLTRIYMEPHPFNPALSALEIATYMYPDDDTKIVRDALGRETTYENYPADAPDVLSRVTLPDGSTKAAYRAVDEIGSHSIGALTVNWEKRQDRQDFNGDYVSIYLDALNKEVAKYFEDDDRWVLFELISNDSVYPRIEHIKTTEGDTYLYYNGDGTLHSADLPDHTITYTYSEDRVETIDVSGTAYAVTYTYDADSDRLKTISDGTESAEFFYDMFSRLERIEYGNGVTARYTYDARDRIEEIVFTQNAEEIKRFRYVLRPNGQVDTVSAYDNGTLSETRVYGYDDLGRLASETVEGSQTYNYTYYDNGNMKNKTVHETGITHHYVYDPNDRLVAETTTGGKNYTYAWDDNGRLLERRLGGAPVPLEHYTFDGEDRLIRVERSTDGFSAPAVVEYEYTPDGRRSRRIVDGGSPTEYVVDTNRRYSEILTEIQNGVETDYYHGDMFPVMLTSEGLYRFLHAGRGGEIRFLTDPIGSITDTYSYGPFGTPTHESGSSFNPYLFSGEYYDETTGLYDLRSRWFSPDIARFLTRDTYVPPPGDYVNLNPYVYAYNDPLNRWDPSGTITLTEVTFSISAVTFLFGALFLWAGQGMKNSSRGIVSTAEMAAMAGRFELSDGMLDYSDGLYARGAGMEEFGASTMAGEMVGLAASPVLGLTLHTLSEGFLLADDAFKLAQYKSVIPGSGNSAKGIGLSHVVSDEMDYMHSTIIGTRQLSTEQADRVADGFIESMVEFDRMDDTARRLWLRDDLAQGYYNQAHSPKSAVQYGRAMPSDFDDRILKQVRAHLDGEAEVFSFDRSFANTEALERWLYHGSPEFNPIDYDRLAALYWRNSYYDPVTDKIGIYPWKFMHEFPSQRKMFGTMTEELAHRSRARAFGQEHWISIEGAADLMPGYQGRYAAHLGVEGPDKLYAAWTDAGVYTNVGEQGVASIGGPHGHILGNEQLPNVIRKLQHPRNPYHELPLEIDAFQAGMRSRFRNGAMFLEEQRRISNSP